MTLKEIIKRVATDFGNNEFDKFIHEVHFPKFKNFAPNSKVEFRFPITVVVGPNGGGKSSILHAVWGMPQGYSTSRFWFSTPVDPIDSSTGEQNRYWYAHYIKSIDRQVQCRKISGNKRNGYWEPSRPHQGEGMDKMPASNAKIAPFMSGSGDRWNQVARTPVYINSKAESSAFERFFYYSAIDTLEDKQDYFLRYSKKLRDAIDQNLSSLSYYTVERLFENYLIPQNLLDEINKILHKNYKSARYLVHNLYGKIRSPSVIFETSKRNYSECFAGSGELAVVNTVLALDKIGTNDLVLLDEPETSLHPGAQRRFLEYLLKVVNDKKVQVVVSTHSPTFVDLLPEEALVVLDETPEGVVARQKPTKVGAFHRLGQPSPNKILILAEDPLLSAFVEFAGAKLPPELRPLIEVEPATVGASEMLSNQVKAYSLAQSKVVLVLDGDQKKVKDIYDFDPENTTTKQKQILISQLKALNVSLVGGDDFFEEWADWCKKHVILIDQVCAEQVLLMCLNPSHPALTNEKSTNRKFKSAVRSEMQSRSLDVDPNTLSSTLKALLAFSSADKPEQLQALADLTEKLKAVIQKLADAPC